MLKLFSRSFILVLLLLVIVLSCAQVPSTFVVSIEAPPQANLRVESGSTESTLITAGNTNEIIVNENDTVNITIERLNQYSTFEVYNWNGVNVPPENEISIEVKSNLTISVTFKELLQVVATAPTDADLKIKTEGTLLKTVSKGETDTIDAWTGTSLFFEITNAPQNHEGIFPNGIQKNDRFTGEVQLEENLSLTFKTELMPYISLTAPENHTLSIFIDEEKISEIFSGDIYSSYIEKHSVLTISVDDIDVNHYRVACWDGLTEVDLSTAYFEVTNDLDVSINISRISRILKIIEDSYQEKVKIFSDELLSQQIDAGSNADSKTLYNIDSGEIVFLQPKNIDGHTFAGWSFDGVESVSEILEIELSEDTIITPCYISNLAEAGIAYVSIDGYESSTANGSKGLPFNNIQDAIDSLSGTGGNVLIASGTYEIDEPILMRAGVSLYGGYQTLNLGANWESPTFTNTDRGFGSELATRIVQNIIASGTSTEYVTVASFSDGDIDSSTVIKGISFGFDSRSRAYTAGMVFKDGASPTIEYCEVISGIASQYSIGIQNIGSSPIILNSYISGNDAKYSYGIHNTGIIDIQLSKVITGEADSYSRGFYNLSATGTSIIDCYIYSKGLKSSGFYGYSYGVHNVSSNVIIKNSEILAGGGGPTSSFGVTIGTRAIFESNSKSVIFGNRINALASSFAGSGASYYGSNASSSFVNNQISIVSGSSVTYGMYLVNSSMNIFGNVIDAGRTSFSGNSYGIYFGSGSSMFINNTVIGGISGGSSDASYAMYLNGNSSVVNNIILTKPSSGERYGIFSFSDKVKSLKHNAFFDITTALFAPQGTQSVFYVLNQNEFLTSITGIDDSNMYGNIAESISNDSPSWTTSLIFEDESNQDYRIKNTAPSSLKEDGLVIDESLLTTLYDGIDVAPNNVNELLSLLETDANGNSRNIQRWTMGAFQH